MPPPSSSKTSEKTQRRLERFGDYFVDAVMLLTAIAGIWTGLSIRFGNPESPTSKDPSWLVLGIVGLMATGLWAERRKTNKQLRENAEAVQSELKRISDNSNVLDALLDLDDEATRQRVLTFANYYARFDRLKPRLDPRPLRFINELLDERFKQFDAFAEGRLTLPMRDAPYANERLVNLFRDRMDAVSDRDLAFWAQHTGGSYYHKSIERRGGKATRRATVTRIFILDHEDFREERFDLTLVVLTQHFKDQVGFAVAFSPGLQDLRDEEGTANEKRELSVRFDFALFDRDQAVTFFRRERPERFLACFATQDKEHANDALIRGQRELWVKLICESWLASDAFVESILGTLTEAEWEVIRQKTSEDNRVLTDKTSFELDHATFPFLVQSEAELESKLKRAYELYQQKGTERVGAEMVGD